MNDYLNKLFKSFG